MAVLLKACEVESLIQNMESIFLCPGTAYFSETDGSQ